MGGHDLWLRACRAFAEQLAREGFYLHAANYLVACNKVGECSVFLQIFRSILPDVFFVYLHLIQFFFSKSIRRFLFQLIFMLFYFEGRRRNNSLA